MVRSPMWKWMGAFLLAVTWSHAAHAQDAEAAGTASQEVPVALVDSVSPDSASDSASLETSDALTLEMMIRNGGPVLWAIMGLGFLAIVLGLYLFFTVTPSREAPVKLVKRVSNQIRAGEIREATQMCGERDELLAQVLYAGLKMADQERYIIQEAMESEGERGAAALWQRISYMNNVGALAPLLGLLGTVWGMIGAFSAIALDNSQVKGLTMAYNVSQAMITTAAGLLLAIPALITYYYLRGRVLKVVSIVETQAHEFVELIIRNQER